MRFITALVALIASAVIAPHTALAWGNGPGNGTGFGTHDWILATGNRLATAQGTTWLDSAVALQACAEPDYISGDQPYHEYDRWGRKYGYAHSRVAALYQQAVSAYRSGNRQQASRLAGLLSHYYADVYDPLQTDNSAAERRIRSRFHRSVDQLLPSANARSWWVAHDGFQKVTSASGSTVSAAKSAHKSYSKLVKEYGRRGFSRTARSIARVSFVRAANGVADMIMSIQQDALEVDASPNVWAHQGVAAGGDCYYVFHTGWVASYDRSWRLLRVNTNPFLGLTGFTQPHVGDGCYHDGKLYVVAENWPAVTNQYIFVFDATTLQRIQAIPTGKTHEVASVCVAPGTGGGDALWIASFLDSSRIFQYDLATGAYVGERFLSPAPRTGIQGISYHADNFYIAVGRNAGMGSLYSASLEGTTTLLYTRWGDGHHEGLEFDGDRMLWLIDNGASSSKIRYLQFPGFLYAQQ